MPEPQTQAKLPFKKSYAFLIGIDKYEHITHLKTAERDARLIGYQLQTLHGFEPHYYLGKEASLEALRLLFNTTIPKLANETDEGPNRIIIYFAGHGYAKDSDGEPEGFLVPWDAEKEGLEKLLPMEEVNQALKEEHINCKHGLLILDCCFAGAFKWASHDRHGGFALPKTIHQSLFEQFTTDPAWQAITSSASDQKAADLINHISLGHRDNEEWKNSPFVQEFQWGDFTDDNDQPINISHHSPFALALFIALRGEGDRILKGGRGDGIITAGEMHNYLRHWVEKVTISQQRRQTPLIIDLPRHDKGEFIFLHPKHPAFLPSDPGRNPYLGLSPYTEEDEKYFFGRGKVITEAIHQLEQKSMLAITGPAGSGKTSLAQAGILPQLRQKGWQVLPSPLNIVNDYEQVVQQLNKGVPSILIIDDFEQFLAVKHEEIDYWEEFLLALQFDIPELRILLLVRTDFELYYSSTKQTLAEGDYLAKWWELWDAGKYRLPPFTKTELRDIITLPARQAVLFFESDTVVNELVNSIHLAPGALPLLSYFLSILYDEYKKSRRTDRTFTQKDIDQIGGLIGALQKRATNAYNSMHPYKQMILRFLLMRMVKFEHGRLTKRKVPFIKLDQIPNHWAKDEYHIWSYVSPEGEEINIYHELDFPDDLDDVMLNKIIEQLVKKERLLLITKDKETQQLYIEPIHDALITFWPLAQKWFEALGTDTILLQRQLWQSVKDHHLIQHQANAIRVAQRDVTNDIANTSLLWDSNPKLLQTTGALIECIINENEWLKKENSGIQDITIDAGSLFPGKIHFLHEDILSTLSSEDQSTYYHICNFFSFQPGDSTNNIKMLSYLSKMSASLTEAIVQQNMHWLNQAEKKFFLDSWRKKEAQIQQLIKQRDEALALAKEANAAALAARGQMLREKNPSIGLNYAYAAYLTLPNTESVNVMNGLSSAGPYYEKVIATEQGDPITGLVFSPVDDNLIVSCNRDGIAKLWDIQHNKCLQVFDDNKKRRKKTVQSPEGKLVQTGVNHGIISLDFSPDGKRILTGCNDGTSVLWDIDTGKKVMEIQAPEGNQKSLAGGYISSKTFLKVDFPKTFPNYTFAHFIPDSGTIMTIHPFRKLQEWNVDQQKEIWSFLLPENNLKQSINICSAVSKSGQYIALGQFVMDGIYFDKNKIQLIDRKNENRITIIPIAKELYPTSLCFNQAEDMLIAGFSNGCWKGYTIPLASEIIHVDAYTKPVRSLNFSSDGKFILTGGEDYDIKVWDIDTGDLVGALRGEFNASTAIAVSKGNTYIAHSYHNAIVLWRQDQHTPKIASSFDTSSPNTFLGRQYPLIMRPANDRKTIMSAYSDNGVTYYRFYNREGEAKRPNIHSNLGLNTCSFSPDGQYFVAAHKDYNGVHKDENNIHIYDLELPQDQLKPKVFSSTISELNIYAIAISNRAKFLLMADRERTSIELHPIDEDSGKILSGSDIDGEPIKAISLSQSQQLFSIRTEIYVEAWTIEANQLVPKASFYARETTPNCVVFSKDEKHLIAGYSDFTAKLWSMDRDNHLIRTFKGHTEAVNCISISTDGKLLLTGSEDGTVRLWDIETGESIQTIFPYYEKEDTEEMSILKTLISSYDPNNRNFYPIEFVGFTDNDRQLMVGYKHAFIRAYYNILHHWPKACFQLPAERRKQLKIDEDIKFPK